MARTSTPQQRKLNHRRPRPTTRKTDERAANRREEILVRLGRDVEFSSASPALKRLWEDCSHLGDVCRPLGALVYFCGRCVEAVMAIHGPVAGVTA